MNLGADRVTRKIRAAQMEALASMLPMTNFIALLNAFLLTVTLWDVLPHADLALWCATFTLMAAIRIRQVLGSARNRTTPGTLYILVLCSALLWSVPALCWHAQAAGNDRLMIFLTTVGVMCGGCVTLAMMPLACWTFVLVLGSVMIGLELHLGQPVLAIMTFGFTLMLGATGLRHALQFVEHQRDKMELEEQAELVELMREFEASGSGWLWELDSTLRLTHLSRDRFKWSERRIQRLLGQPIREILDPSGRIAQVSQGVRQVFEQLDQQTGFRDVAVPTPEGRWWSLSAKPVFDGDGACIGWRGIGSDITDVRLKGSDAVHAARRDPLTGLANRLMIREQLEEAMIHSVEAGCVLMIVDLDRFKLVNDTLGHAVGDELLKEVAIRLKQTVGQFALVGRLGGDEFAILWPMPLSRVVLSALAGKLIAELSACYRIAGTELRIGATIGIAVAPCDGHSHDELTASADLALYRAKEDGRGTHRFYERWIGERAKANRQLESDLRSALQHDGLSLAYQPIVSARGGRIVGFEALLRWRHPTQGDIPPDRFVPIIEDAGLMNNIGSWVIRQACAEAARWPMPYRIAVNVSAAQLTGSKLTETITDALATSKVKPERLEIEVTESVFIGDDEATLASLARLRALGVRLVIDDFGKGYSSFGYLSRAHFSKIKIDQSFVHGAAAGEREHLAIVEAIIALARRLDIETTAEGVETPHQERVMRQLGCQQFQGFRFGRPGPTAALPLPTARAA